MTEEAMANRGGRPKTPTNLNELSEMKQITTTILAHAKNTRDLESALKTLDLFGPSANLDIFPNDHVEIQILKKAAAWLPEADDKSTQVLRLMKDVAMSIRSIASRCNSTMANILLKASEKTSKLEDERDLSKASDDELALMAREAGIDI